MYIYEAMCALYTFRFSLALSGSPEPFSLFHQWVLFDEIVSQDIAQVRKPCELSNLCFNNRIGTSL